MLTGRLQAQTVAQTVARINTATQMFGPAAATGDVAAAQRPSEDGVWQGSSLSHPRFPLPRMESCQMASLDM